MRFVSLKVSALVMVSLFLLSSFGSMVSEAAPEPMDLVVDVDSGVPFEHVFGMAGAASVVLVGFTGETQIVVTFDDVSSDVDVYQDGLLLGVAAADTSTLFMLVEDSTTYLSFNANKDMMVDIDIFVGDQLACPLDCTVYGETVEIWDGSYSLDLMLSSDFPYEMTLSPYDPVTFFSLTDGSISRFTETSEVTLEELPAYSEFARISSTGSTRFCVELAHQPMPPEDVHGNVVFGPVYLERGTGASTDYSFMLETVPGPGTLHIWNNGLSSAKVYLNGEKIVAPSAFSKNVKDITRDITLGDENFLFIELRSNPKDGLMMWIEVNDNLPVDPIGNTEPFVEPISSTYSTLVSETTPSTSYDIVPTSDGP